MTQPQCQSAGNNDSIHRTAPDQPEQEEYQVQYEDGSWSREVRTRDKQPEQFSKEDMIGFAEWIEMGFHQREKEYGVWYNSYSHRSHPSTTTDQLLTEYIKNKK